MIKIGKGFSLILIITFLCQNLAFCVPEGYSKLRVPISNSSARMKDVIGVLESNNRLTEQADALMDTLLDKWLQSFKFDLSRPDDLIEARRVIFERVRDIAYDISSSTRPKDNLAGFGALVGHECSGSCIFKHYLLAKMMEKLGVPKARIRYLTVPIQWDNMGINYSDELRTMAKGLKGITRYHIALEVDFEGNGNWVTLDATWDLPLRSHSFKVNTYWDGVSKTDLGVIKSKNEEVITYGTIEEVDQYFASQITSLSSGDKKKLIKFYNLFDKWLRDLRKYGEIDKFLKKYFLDGVDEKIIHEISVALSRGIINYEKLAMALDSLKKASSLPVSVDQDFIIHIVTWLEIINQEYFVPVITHRHRLDKIIDTLTKNPYVDLKREGSAILDVGTGYLPKITAMLANRFDKCNVFGIDIIFADYFVNDLHGTGIVFDKDGKLLALHSDNAMRLHRMIVDFEHTNERFSDLFKRLKAKLPKNKFYYKDLTMGEIFSDPVIRLKEDRVKNQKRLDNLHFIRNVAKGFDISSLIFERFDAIWTWNALIHFDRDTRINALFEFKKVLKPKGIIIEGYASPSGNTAIYALWQEDKGDLVMREFVFSSQNLKYPLWDMKDEDYLVGLLGKFISLIKSDEQLQQRLKPNYPQISSSISTRAGLLELIIKKIKEAGYIAELNKQHNLVIKFTGEDEGKIRLSSFDTDIAGFLNETRLSKKPGTGLGQKILSIAPLNDL